MPLRSALLAGAVACLASAAAAAPAPNDAERQHCLRLITIFDEIVQSRFDAPTLGIPDRRLQEARVMRRDAEDDCLAGQTWFGLEAIEAALRQIGYLPPPRPAPDAPP
jgi:hypothetical protein